MQGLSLYSNTIFSYMSSYNRTEVDAFPLLNVQYVFKW